MRPSRLLFALALGLTACGGGASSPATTVATRAIEATANGTPDTGTSTVVPTTSKTASTSTKPNDAPTPSIGTNAPSQPTASSPKTTSTSTPPPLTGSITVLAATSLTNAFRAIEQAFEAAHPGADVTMSFGASSTLATQIKNGAPADVFASADVDNIAKVAGSLASGYSIFATNFLQIMVAAGNPKNVQTLADLANPDLIVITAQPGVPIRSYTDEVLSRAGVSANFRSFEANVSGIVTKITSGAADAGIVYRTDVINAGSKAQGVRIPVAQNVVAEYPIGVLSGSGNPRLATAFVRFVNGPGQSILGSFGFGDE